jgi:hypothetical protein
VCHAPKHFVGSSLCCRCRFRLTCGHGRLHTVRWCVSAHHVHALDALIQPRYHTTHHNVARCVATCYIRCCLLTLPIANACVVARLVSCITLPNRTDNNVHDASHHGCVLEFHMYVPYSVPRAVLWHVLP